MHIVVVGAGLIGVTSAYRLRQAGHAVTVIEQEPAVARGASWANGGLLTPSMADPWNAPGFWKHLVRSMGHTDAPLLLLVLLMPLEYAYGFGRYRNSSMGALGLATSARAALNLACNAQFLALEIGIFPTQAEQLALPQPAIDRHVIERHQAIRAATTTGFVEHEEREREAGCLPQPV